MTNRIALITGGSRGLGRASALALAESGADIVLTYNTDAESAQAVVDEIQAMGRKAVALQLDTTAFATFPAFGDSLKDVLADTWDSPTFDALVNNAGYAGDTLFGSTTQESIEQLVAVHLTGVVLLTQQVAPLLADGGRILNVSSGLTRNPVNPVYSVYAAVKSAVETWSLYLAKQLGERRIAVNVIAPGATATDFAGGAVRDNDAYRGMIVASVAMGRVGEADDVGRAVAAILDPRMGWVTGQRIEASGGQRL